MRLSDSFYKNSALITAPALLGKLLCINDGGKIQKYRITETECYMGEKDTACHAHKGRTPRTEPLYMKGGTAYVYLCYGMHNMFNVITGEDGDPQGVLLRSISDMNGPGRLTKLTGIDRSFNKIDMTVSDRIWIEDDGTFFEYTADKRVGINYASEEYRDKLWRFIAVTGKE